MPINNSHIAFIGVYDIGASIIEPIVDFGVMTGEKAHFSKMGRDVKYLIYGYDGESLVPICTPFVLQKSGVVNYIKERK